MHYRGKLILNAYPLNVHSIYMHGILYIGLLVSVYRDVSVIH